MIRNTRFGFMTDGFQKQPFRASWIAAKRGRLWEKGFRLLRLQSLQQWGLCVNQILHGKSLLWNLRRSFSSRELSFSRIAKQHTLPCRICGRLLPSLMGPGNTGEMVECGFHSPGRIPFYLYHRRVQR